MDALTFLDALPGVVESSPDLVDEAVVLESIDGRTYGEAPRSGLSFIVGANGRIDTVHLHADGHEGYSGYVGAIPSGIRFEMSRPEVRAILGAPSALGEPRYIEFYGEGPAWDRFDLGRAHMHVEYVKDLRSIRLVTLIKPSAVPGLT
jgi:hypothetical protein